MNTAVQSALLLLVSFVLIGQIQVLITKEVLDTWLQKFSGIKGMPFYIFIAFIFVKNVYDFTRISMEVTLINPNITLIRNLITLSILILVGLLAKRFYKNRTIESIFMKAGVKDGSDDSNS